MSEQPDDDLVPPLKVMRKRLNGVYRADTGFSGPTRRYVLIVALLVGLASVPTLAAITAGSNELADGGTDTMDIPFLPPASPGPVHPDSRVGASPPVLPPGVAGTALRAGRLLGKAGPIDTYAGKHVTRGSPKSGSDKSTKPRRSTGTVVRVLPGMPAIPHLPSVDGRSDSSSSAAALDPADFADGSDVVSELSDIPDGDEPAPRRSRCARSAETDSDRSPDRSQHSRRPAVADRSSQYSRRSAVADRTEHSRRSPVAERPQNIRASRILERSYFPIGVNTRHLIPEARTEDNQSDRPYRGSHRAPSLHHADDTPAQRRSSRVGRHHAEPNTEDLSGRW